LEQIPAVLRKTITTFTTDMWDGYLQAADDFVQEHDDVEGEIVVDRFHVAQNYRGGFDALRKKELKRLKQELSDECYDQDCKGMLWVLRKNHDALNREERQRLRILFKHTPLLHQAYTFREELTAIFDRPYTLAQAQRAIETWCHKVRVSPVCCYDRFIKTLQKYRPYILNYFNRRVSSGFVEGLNNKIKTIKRRCYGINKVSTLFQRIWLDLQGRELFFLSTP
jgi:transposase